MNTKKRGSGIRSVINRMYLTHPGVSIQGIQHRISVSDLKDGQIIGRYSNV